MKKEKLYCPVRRLEKPGVSIDIEKGKDNLLNIKGTIKVGDKITPILLSMYNKIIGNK